MNTQQKKTNQNPFKITILTLYEESFPSHLGFGVVGRALKKGLWTLDVINIRDFAIGSYKKVDDKVFGGGKGLLLMPEVLSKAIEFAFDKGASKNLIYPSPAGKVFNHSMSENFSKLDGLTFICGHFEGIDDRIIQKYKPMEISIGDYILSGGELSATVIIDSVLRFVPYVLNSFECTEEESFSNGLLEYPQYTQPASWQDMNVPEVLCSGNHKKIKEWRLQKSLEKTKEIRPDLFEKYVKDNSSNNK